MRTLVTLSLLPFLLTLCCGMALAENSPTPSPASASGSGVEGVMTISPTHGGPIRQGEVDTKPLPNVAFVVQSDSKKVASFVTDAQGKFHVSLPPGKYQLLAEDQRHKFGNWGPFPFEVTAGKMTTVTFDCDSGLR